MDVCLLISCTLTFPSIFVPPPLKSTSTPGLSHMTNYHVYERVSHNKRVSARTVEGCGSVPNSCPCTAQAQLAFETLPATMDNPRRHGWGAVVLAQGQRAPFEHSDQYYSKDSGHYTQFCGYSYFTNEGQSPTSV